MRTPSPLRSRLGRAALVGALALALPLQPAFAEKPSTAELERLRARFREGIAFEEEGKWKEALAVFEEIAATKRSAAVAFHLALCAENLAKLTRALEGFREASDLAAASETQDAEVAEKAKKRLAALEQRVPTLRVKGVPAGAELSVNGFVWSAEKLGVAVPVDPGTFLVELKREGDTTRVAEVTLTEGEHETVTVKRPKEDAPAPPLVPPRPEEPEPAPSGNKIPAIVVGSVGLGALAAGAVLFGLGQAAIGEVKETCNADLANCDPDKVDVAEQGETYHYASIGLLSGGAACVATAIALWFTVGADPAPASGAARARVMVEPGRVVLRVSY